MEEGYVRVSRTNLASFSSPPAQAGATNVVTPMQDTLSDGFSLISAQAVTINVLAGKRHSSRSGTESS